jgi:hypothetical protein
MDLTDIPEDLLTEQTTPLFDILCLHNGLNDRIIYKDLMNKTESQVVDILQKLISDIK